MKCVFLSAFVSIVVLTACASVDDQRPPDVPASAIRGVAIERPDVLAGRSVGGLVPVARLSVAGKSGLFLLDTGASHTVLAPGFAGALGVSAVAHVSGADSGGAIVNGSVLAPKPLEAPGLGATVMLAQPLVLDLGPLEDLGLAGVAAPHTLMGEGCVAIDFPSNRLIVDRSRPDRCVSPAARPPDYQASGSSCAGARRPMIVAKVGDARDDVRFLLDTGAAMTSIAEEAADGLAVVGKRTSRGVGGRERKRRLVGPVALGVGAHRVSLDSVFVEPLSEEGSKLGMDVLKDARILLTADRCAAVWFEDD